MVAISTQYPHLYVNAMINIRIDKTIIHVQCNQCRSFQSMFFIQIIYYSTHNLQFKLAVGSRHRRQVCHQHVNHTILHQIISNLKICSSQ